MVIPRTWCAASQRVKPSSTCGRSWRTVATIGALAPAAERLRHRLDRLRHPQPVASEVVSQFVEPHRSDLTDGARIHRLVSSGRGSEKGSGGPERSRNPPAPSSFWGQFNPYAGVWPATIPVNQLRARGTGVSVDAVALAGPAAATAAPARSPAATPDGRTGCKTADTDSAWRVRSALRTPDGRSKKIRIPPLALTLAPLRRTLARGVRRRGVGCLGFGLAAALGAATPVPPALVAAFLLAVGRPPVLSAGSPSPPPTCRRATLGATVPSLGMGRSEELLAPLEQTPPLSRPTSPLTGSRLAASLEWAQGSCELPTAKPRARSPLCSAPRRFS